jgi:hypothetical protein
MAYPTPPAAGTFLTITPVSPAGASFQIPPLPARDVTQTLDEIEPIGGASLGDSLIDYDGNGNLISYVRPQFQKLKSTITGNAETIPPALNGSWRGTVVLVNCIVRRYYPSGGTADRAIVPGTSPITEGDFVWFFPQLTMTVIRATLNNRERGIANSWQIDLLEGAAAT